ncbi:response regulator transcription factor [Paraburkholderia kururiensis]|uniref:response regulator transcription factor n=1 Tax=Paraburkholderia kururiensis TaxID=984307 RepID=UPI000F898FD2|nr:response regulator transcription factor [Paraburkholderia kururiensis]
MRIAILDNDPAWLELAAGVLGRAGHRCEVFRRGHDLTVALDGQAWDLVMLGRNARDMSGDAVLRWIRGNCHANLPVLVTTARATPGDVAHFLNAGADDYVIRPVDPDILAARVSALLRRSGGNGVPAARLAYRDFLFDLKEERAYRRGQYVALSRKQFGLAVLFFRNAGRPLSRAYLFEAVWGHTDRDVLTRTVDTHVWAVRALLGLRPENGYLIVPLYGYGYRFEDLAQKGVPLARAGVRGVLPGDPRKAARALTASLALPAAVPGRAPEPRG